MVDVADAADADADFDYAIDNVAIDRHLILWSVQYMFGTMEIKLLFIHE